jgi:hypothetical protein
MKRRNTVLAARDAAKETSLFDTNLIIEQSWLLDNKREALPLKMIAAFRAAAVKKTLHA